MATIDTIVVENTATNVVEVIQYASGGSGGGGTVTSVGLSAGTGIRVTGGPIESSGYITVTNTAPDQVVSLTGSGTTTVTGTYPNFTITSSGGGGGTGGAVTSVNSKTGDVVLTTTDVTEGSNQYFTTARARASVSATGSLTYNSATGVISYTQPANISTFTNDSNFITSTALTAYLTTASAASTYQTQTGMSSYLTTTGAANAYQPKDADLTAIAALSGTSGLLKKTAADTWGLDTATYITGNQQVTLSGDVTGSGTTAITTTLANTGVTAGSYTNTTITVDEKGRITAASSGTGGGGGGSMVYPGSGIANSNGSAWGTSYSTVGNGTVLALAASPTITGTIGLSGTNLSAAAWTTAGIAIKQAATTYTDTTAYTNASFTGSISGTTLNVTLVTSGIIAIGMLVTGTNVTSGTVITAGAGSTWTVSISQAVGSTALIGLTLLPDVRMNALASQTFAASNPVGATTVYGTYFSDPLAGTNVTAQTRYALGADGMRIVNAAVVGGAFTASGAVNMSTAGSTISIGTGQTTGLLTLGGTTGTNTITLGQSTVSQTTNIQAGNISTGTSIKTINIGTGATAAGSATNITIGTPSAPSTTTLNGTVTVGVQGTAQGSLNLANLGSAGSTTIRSSNTALAAYTITLPVNAGSSGQVLQTDGTGVTSWVTSSGGGATASTRVSSQATTTGSFAWNSDSYDVYAFTALDASISLALDGGAPVDGRKILFRFKASGANRDISFSVNQSKGFRLINFTSPLTLGSGKTLYLGCIYNAFDDRWDVAAVTQEV